MKKTHKDKNEHDLLCDFFKYFRDHGEACIGMTIEEFVSEYLKNRPDKNPYSQKIVKNKE